MLGQQVFHGLGVVSAADQWGAQGKQLFDQALNGPFPLINPTSRLIAGREGIEVLPTDFPLARNPLGITAIVAQTYISCQRNSSGA